MAWHKLEAGEVVSVAVNSVTGAETVRPKLFATRTVSIANAAVDTPAERVAAGQLTSAWSAFGVLANNSAMNLAATEDPTVSGGGLPLGLDVHAIYTAEYTYQGRSTWAQETVKNYANNGSKTWLDDYMAASDAATQSSTSVDVLQGLSPILLDLDRTTNFRFSGQETDYYASSSTTTAFSGVTIGYAGPGVGGRNTDPTLVASYKSAPRPPKFPQLVPRWVGSTKADFIFPVDVGTVESTATIYIRWAAGDGITERYEQAQIVPSARGLDPAYYTATITGLLPNTLYTAWIHIERDSSINTTVSGLSATFRTEASSAYAYAVNAGTDTSVQVTPTSARFTFSIDVSRTQRATKLYLPAVTVEVIRQADHALHGWDENYIIRSVQVGPFYEQQTWSYISIGGSSAYVSEGISNFDTPREVADVLSATIEMTGLTQATEYFWRLRVDGPDSTDYPIDGLVLNTPPFDPSRPNVSPQFTLGGF
jgi:hypothetical protein